MEGRKKMIDNMKQFIPARGRKLFPGIATRAISRNNSSPQGDGNAHSLNVFFNLHGNNSSPQGDGNIPPSAELVPPMKQFIPARGRKHTRVIAPIKFETKQFIPARGRKPTGARPEIKPARKQFIPARGRKQVRNMPLVIVRVETIHPRKWTETILN